MLGKCFRWAAILAVGLQVAGCYEDFGPVAALPEPIAPPIVVADVLQSGDVVKVTIYGEEGLTGTYTIDPAGNINMPLVGPIRAAGRTNPQLEREITQGYTVGKFLQDPKVTVDAVSFRPIYILGEALRPGAYPYSSGLNVLTAVTLAGGPTYRAARNKVLIQHAGEVVWQEYPMSAAVSIMPGDLIRLPERYF
jgi:polysaccharide export outer membrane protein